MTKEMRTIYQKSVPNFCISSQDASQKSLKWLIKKLRSNSTSGLEQREVEHRILACGKNKLLEKKEVTFWQVLIRQFEGLVVWILISAALVSIYLGEWEQSIAIGVVVLINTVIGLLTELKATRSMEALAKIGKTTDKVLRNNNIQEIISDELVPGDIVLVEAGDIVSADMRLINSSRLEVNESSFTGESLPIQKSHLIESKSDQISEIKNMVFRGTSIVNGTAKAIVVNTGMETEIGKIAELTMSTRDEKTPLEIRLNLLGKKLVKVTIIVSILVSIAGIVAGKDTFLMLEMAIALTIAAIPEGLPIVATMALARGMIIMAKKNALINKLASVETLGATTIIFSDKTGTLTENKMSVVAYYCNHYKEYSIENIEHKPQDKNLEKCLRIGALCNNAHINESSDETLAIGDTMEVALLDVLNKSDIKLGELRAKFKKIKEVAFDYELRMMATYHQDADKIFVAVKGAPEAILNHCSKVIYEDDIIVLSSQQLNEWLEVNERQSQMGTRILALAYKYVSTTDESPYTDLIFTGLVEIKDPPCKGIEKVIDECRNAGVRTIMITGDQAGTALSIAKQVHIVKDSQDVENVVLTGKNLDQYKRTHQFDLSENIALRKCNVFARVTPQQKLELIDLYQAKGAVVAMTGDGVNDAPALKKADIGVAMGIRGTQVAKEASDVVLKDDKFTSIVAAIFQGRVIFNNIRVFVIYLISCNMSEVLSVGMSSVINLPLPIHPLQILFLNLVTDVFPALALGVGHGDDSIMKTPPRSSKEDIINSKSWWTIVAYGVLITLSVVGSLAYSLYVQEVSQKMAVTVSFFTMAFAQVVHVFNMRESHSNFFYNEITKNMYVWFAIILCIILMLMTIWIPALRNVLKIETLAWYNWNVIIIFSLLPLILIQAYKLSEKLIPSFFKSKSFN